MEVLSLSDVVKECTIEGIKNNSEFKWKCVGIASDGEERVITIPEDKSEEVIRAIVLIMNNEELKLIK